MTIHLNERGIIVLEGDSRDILRATPDDTFDSIVTDPPYGLSFMGRDWDKALPDPEIWREALRAAKPGAYLVAFGHPRLYHRLACQIEDAGWEIRDCLQWLFGTGFPKSLDVSKAIDKAAGSPEAERWDGWGTALKPAYEPILLARKPLIGTVAKNVLEHGTGGINIDACRVGTSKDVPGSVSQTNGAVYGTFGGETGQESGHDPNVGRWPANLILDEEAGAVLDAQTGQTTSRANPRHNSGFKSQSFGAESAHTSAGHSDSGGASRFFYCAKASRKEREQGLDAFESSHVDPTRAEGSKGRASPRAGAGRGSERKNVHPTVKPIALIRWLTRLVTPPGGLVLDPFLGSGTGSIAAIEEGFRHLGIERDPKFAEIAAARARGAL